MASKYFVILSALYMVFVIQIAHPQQQTTFYDNRGNVTHRWIQQGDHTTVVDNSNRIIGYRHYYHGYRHDDGRVEISDNARNIIGYQEED